MALNVGQGIRDKMAEAGDVPWKGSTFGKNGAGQKTETAKGLLGDYRSLELEPGVWRTEGPLPVAG